MQLIGKPFPDKLYQIRHILGNSCKKMGILRVAQAQELIDKCYGISTLYTFDYCYGPIVEYIVY